MIAATPGSASARLVSMPRTRACGARAQQQLAEQHALGAEVLGVAGAAGDLGDDVGRDVVAADESLCHDNLPVKSLSRRSPKCVGRIIRVTSAAVSRPRLALLNIVIAIVGVALLVFTVQRAGGWNAIVQGVAGVGWWFAGVAAARRVSDGLPHARLDGLRRRSTASLQRCVRRVDRVRRDGQPDAARPARQRADQDPDDSHEDLDGDQHRLGHDRERVLHRVGVRRAADGHVAVPSARERAAGPRTGLPNSSSSASRWRR